MRSPGPTTLRFGLACATSCMANGYPVNAGAKPTNSAEDGLALVQVYRRPRRM
jgi:hypothetical protein